MVIMRQSALVLLIVGIASLPFLASAHPPLVDVQNSCLVDKGFSGSANQTVTVVGTLTYLAPLGTSMSCPATTTDEWGSHAAPCPVSYVGPVAGAYCGPIVLAGDTGSCTWVPVLNTVLTNLTIGFDTPAIGTAPWGNGVVNLLLEGEMPVFGEFPPGTWVVSNPYGVDARVIAYPTTDSPGLLAPADINEIVCVTP